MKIGIGTAALVLLVLAAPLALGATEAQKQQAIDDGLAWLAGIQLGDGRWNNGDNNYDTATTGAALLSFLEEGYRAGTDVVIGGTNHGDVVGKGVNFLLSRAQVYDIGLEPTGDPDADGNGIGVKFVPGGNNPRDTYVTGLVVPALASTGTPDALVTTGPLAGRTDGTGPGGAWTHRDVVQNAVDYFAYGQADPGNEFRGGWRYYADYGQADNSTSQWPVISMLYATKMGVSTPDFVKRELRYWTDTIQNDFPGVNINDGGSNYYRKNDYSWASNVSRTGTWLSEAFLTGTDPSQVTTADVEAALGYLNRVWAQNTSGTWNGNVGHPYAMWAAYKGLELTIGIDDMTTIMPRAQGAAIIDNPDHGWNWWEDYCEYLVSTQATSGAWGGYSYWTGPLATAWNINILAATEIPGGEDPIPEPGTFALIGAGLLALAWTRRRRRAS